MNISTKTLKTTADYLQLYRQVSQGDFSKGKSLRVAFLSSFTLNLFKEIFTIHCLENGISPEIYVGGYNQIDQDVFQPESPLYQFQPDVIIIFSDTRSLLGDVFFHPYKLTKEERKKMIDDRLGWAQSLTGAIRKQSQAKILFHNFEVPSHSPLGPLESKQDFGFREMIQTLNGYLQKAFVHDTQVFVVDYENFVGAQGKSRIMDQKMYYLADMKLSFDFYPALASTYLSYLKPMVGLTRKCLVLDLDNTLWGGIIGEDGLDGIHLGPTPEGRPYYELQQTILSLYERGVILAINSKNNEEDALRAIREHPYMVLKEKHFSSIRINWDDKAQNLQHIATELNIGLDSLVFMDDDPANRDLVSQVLPEVVVWDVPKDQAQYLDFVMSSHDFDSLALTEEDKKKGQMYAEQKQRADFQETATNMEDYLRGLEMLATLESVSSFSLPRVAQLSQKTNQFNLTTRRYKEEQLRSFLEGDHHFLFSVQVKDKFGDNGVVGYVVLDLSDDTARIDEFLMSCRVIGRGVEKVLLANAVELAKSRKKKKICGEYIPTQKNDLAKTFYSSHGFVLKGREKEKETWEFDLSHSCPYPNYIQVNKHG